MNSEDSPVLPGFKVRVLPAKIELEVMPRESVLQAARRQGIFWPNICGGYGTCTACYCTIEKGIEAANSRPYWELRRLETVGKQGRFVRLACQLHANGPMELYKEGVRAHEQAPETPTP
jgi:ferredoxin